MAERCQWLTETVDDSMRWLIHEEGQKIGTAHAFPRVWCGAGDVVMSFACAHRRQQPAVTECMP